MSRSGRLKLETNGGSLPSTLAWRTEHDDDDDDVAFFDPFDCIQRCGLINNIQYCSLLTDSFTDTNNSLEE